MDKEQQSVMEKRVRDFLEDIRVNQAGTILGMLEPRFVECDAAEHSIVLAYPARPWEANPLGIMQGGVMATMLDFTAAALSVCFAGDAPVTVSLQVSYLRGAPVKGELLVRARATKSGRQLVHAFVECWPAGEPDKPAATANCVYIRT